MKTGCSTSDLRNGAIPSQPSGHMDTGRYPVTANRGAFYGSAHPLRMGDRSCPEVSTVRDHAVLRDAQAASRTQGVYQ
jgi:hypothetical protein